MDRRIERRLGSFGARGSAVLLAGLGVVLTLGLVAPFATSAPSFVAARNYATGGSPFGRDRRPERRRQAGPGDRGCAISGARSPCSQQGRRQLPGQARLRRNRGVGATSVAIGDLNGDGKPDLVTANAGPTANFVSVLINRGDGTFQARLDYATGPGPYSVAIGDLNGDGKPDLATANDGDNTVSVLVNKGDGSFQARVDYATGVEPSSVAIGDLNGDGKPDLVTANSGTYRTPGEKPSPCSSTGATVASRPGSTTEPALALSRSRSAT